MKKKLFCYRLNEKNFSVKNEADETVAHVYHDNGRYFAYCAGNHTTCTFESDGTIVEALRRLMRQLDKEICLVPESGSHIRNYQKDACRLAWRTSHDGWQLHAQTSPGVMLHTLLGWIRFRKDGRWDWFVRPNRNFFRPACPEEKLQGVVEAEWAAREAVESYWMPSPLATGR